MLVYKITNTKNGKVYIGKTTKTLDARRRVHIRNAPIRSHLPLYRAMLRDGVDNFTFETIGTCETLEELNKREREIISAHKSNDRNIGYNLTEGGDGGAQPEHVLKIIGQKVSIANKGKKRSDEARRNISLGHIGLKYSEQQKKAMSERAIRLGIRPPPGYRLSGENHPMFGKHHSIEARAKLVKARLGLTYAKMKGEEWASGRRSVLRERWKGESNPLYKSVDVGELGRLLRSDLKVEEVTSALGVSHPTVISKCKEYFGMKPNEYRKSNKI